MQKNIRPHNTIYLSNTEINSNHTLLQEEFARIFLAHEHILSSAPRSYNSVDTGIVTAKHTEKKSSLLHVITLSSFFYKEPAYNLFLQETKICKHKEVKKENRTARTSEARRGANINSECRVSVSSSYDF